MYTLTFLHQTRQFLPLFLISVANFSAHRSCPQTTDGSVTTDGPVVVPQTTDGSVGGGPAGGSSSLLLSSLELSGTKVYEPQIRALLGTASHFCEVVVLK